MLLITLSMTKSSRFGSNCTIALTNIAKLFSLEFDKERDPSPLMGIRLNWTKKNIWPLTRLINISLQPSAPRQNQL